jgi:trans-aconitate methyltransferase
VAKKIPERLRWAVETLAVNPADNILEIGCGHGHAVSLICERLTTGKIMGIDRSQTSIDKAIANNSKCIAANKAEFHNIAIDQFEYGEYFNKIFAVNINVFWLKPANELRAIKNLLMPNGRLYLFYEPPSHSQANEIADKVKRNLADNFVVQDVLFTTLNSMRGVCIIAQQRQRL